MASLTCIACPLSHAQQRQLKACEGLADSEQLEMLRETQPFRSKAQVMGLNPNIYIASTRILKEAMMEHSSYPDLNDLVVNETSCPFRSPKIVVPCSWKAIKKKSQLYFEICMIISSSEAPIPGYHEEGVSCYFPWRTKPAEDTQRAGRRSIAQGHQATACLHTN